MELRYGGLLARIDTARVRINEYINGEIEKLEELEQERLHFDGAEWPEYVKPGRFNECSKIATASSMENV